jgi:hypothetical protein
MKKQLVMTAVKCIKPRPPHGAYLGEAMKYIIEFKGYGTMWQRSGNKAIIVDDAVAEARAQESAEPTLKYRVVPLIEQPLQPTYDEIRIVTLESRVTALENAKPTQQCPSEPKGHLGKWIVVDTTWKRGPLHLSEKGWLGINGAATATYFNTEEDANRAIVATKKYKNGACAWSSNEYVAVEILTNL